MFDNDKDLSKKSQPKKTNRDSRTDSGQLKGKTGERGEWIVRALTNQILWKKIEKIIGLGNPMRGIRRSNQSPKQTRREHSTKKRNVKRGLNRRLGRNIVVKKS